MDKNKTGLNDRNWLVWGGIYAAVFLVVIGVLNYSTPYSSSPVTDIVPWQLILWGLLYLPIIVVPLTTGRKIIDFGFTLSPFLALAFLFITMLCASFAMAVRVSWGSAVIEAFARSGEEVFFRGFLIVLFTRLFDKKHRSWLWAAIASSILFALAHTQTFQPSFLSQYGSPSVPVVYTIMERLFNNFGVALVLALLRVWTRSILPGAIAHGILKAGIQTLPFVLAIYFLVIFWAYRRGEKVAFGTGLQIN